MEDARVREDRGRYSVTGLMVYESCPYQYYATYVAGKPPPVTPAMRRGAGVHALIAQHFRQPPLLPVEPSPDIAPLFNTFLASRFNTPAVDVERPFVLPFDRGDVHGRIDLVLPGPDGRLELVDFKSGTARAVEELEQRLQLRLYAIATARAHEVAPERLTYTYYFLGDNREVNFAPSVESFLATTDRVERIIHAIEEGRFERRAGCRCHACRGDFGLARRRARARSR